jgi:hypothetical protein
LQKRFGQDLLFACKFCQLNPIGHNCIEMLDEYQLKTLRNKEIQEKLNFKKCLWNKRKTIIKLK